MNQLVTGEESPNAAGSKGGKADADLTMLVYVLHALALFFFVSSLVAIIINYVKRDDVRGTWLESHFDWQISTFWWSLVFGIGASAMLIWGLFQKMWALAILAVLVALFNLVWWAYRIIKGVLRLNDKREVD